MNLHWKWWDRIQAIFSNLLTPLLLDRNAKQLPWFWFLQFWGVKTISWIILLLTYFLIKSLSEFISVFVKIWSFCIALKCRNNISLYFLIFNFDLIKGLAPYIWKLLIMLEFCHTMLFFLFNVGVKTEVKTWNIEQLNTKNYLLVIFWRLLKFKGLGSIFYHNIFCFIGWIEKCMFFDSLWSKPIKVKMCYQVWYNLTMPVN